MKNSPKMIKIFTPSFADENNINAQNLTVKQIVRRLDPDYFQVTMFYKDNIADFIKIGEIQNLLNGSNMAI